MKMKRELARGEFVWGRAPSPVQAERTGAPVKPGVGLTGWSSSAAAGGHSKSGFAGMKLPAVLRALFALALLAFSSAVPSRAFAYAQEQSAAQPSQQTPAERSEEHTSELQSLRHLVC